jgi:hypothetical protein
VASLDEASSAGVDEPKCKCLIGLAEWSWHLSRQRLLGLCLAVAAQVATLAITWPLWQPRAEPTPLPLISGLAAWHFGPLLCASLALTLLTPRWGWTSHVALLLLAIAADQFRLQPQFIGLALLIWATASPLGWRLARWNLAALWLWAGLHKALSAEWWSDYPWSLLTQAGIEPAGKTELFAVGVIAIELTLGLLAIWRPRWAIPLCLLVHLGIVVLFSPWLANRNFSVLPWNLATAVLGSAILWTSRCGWPQRKGDRAVAAFLLLIPATYYLGWLDRGLAHVLYAGNVPRGIVARGGEVREIEGWGELAVPFPAQERLLIEFFRRSTQPSERLLIRSPLFGGRERYFIATGEGEVRELLTGDAEFTSNFGPGNLPDDPRAIKELITQGVKLLRRSPEEMIFAAEIPADAFQRRSLELLQRLPNLEQLQLRNCPLDENDLRNLLKLRTLRGLGLEGTPLDPNAIEQLERLPLLEVIER